MPYASRYDILTILAREKLGILVFEWSIESSGFYFTPYDTYMIKRTYHGHVRGILIQSSKNNSLLHCQLHCKEYHRHINKFRTFLTPLGQMLLRMTQLPVPDYDVTDFTSLT